MLSIIPNPGSDSDSERPDDADEVRSTVSTASTTFSERAIELERENMALKQQAVSDTLRIVQLEAELSRQRQIAAQVQQELASVKQENERLRDSLLENKLFLETDIRHQNVEFKSVQEAEEQEEAGARELTSQRSAASNISELACVLTVVQEQIASQTQQDYPFAPEKELSDGLAFSMEALNIGSAKLTEPENEQAHGEEVPIFR